MQTRRRVRRIVIMILVMIAATAIVTIIMTTKIIKYSTKSDNHQQSKSCQHSSR